MKYYKFLLLPLFASVLFTSCSKDEEIVEERVEEPTISTKDLQVEYFMHRVMSDVYLYKDDVAALADDYFPSYFAKQEFLNRFSSPEKLFSDGLKASHDNYSNVMDELPEMQRGSVNGSMNTNGMAYQLWTYCNGCPRVYGSIRLVRPNSSADNMGLERGMIFNRVDGEQLTMSNYRTLLASSSYSIGLAKFEGDNIRSLSQTAFLRKQSYINNPVGEPKILDINGRKIGYLYYDRFVANFDEELNAAFGQLKASGVEDLVLDLRYNSGGSVRSSVDLASMITGQFPEQVFMKEKWNDKYQKYYEENDPEMLLHNFNINLRTGTTINSLNLNRVFVLTSSITASASECIINGLEPYIEVIHIGNMTYGKYVATRLTFDSPTYSRYSSQLNTSHSYAVAPVIYKALNANDVTDYDDGLNPDVTIRETPRNMGILGDPDEPLLRVALDLILGNRSTINEVDTYPEVGDSDMFEKIYPSMYSDTEILPIIME